MPGEKTLVEGDPESAIILRTAPCCGRTSEERLRIEAPTLVEDASGELGDLVRGLDRAGEGKTINSRPDGLLN